MWPGAIRFPIHKLQGQKPPREEWGVDFQGRCTAPAQQEAELTGPAQHFPAIGPRASGGPFLTGYWTQGPEWWRGGLSDEGTHAGVPAPSPGVLCFRPSQLPAHDLQNAVKTSPNTQVSVEAPGFWQWPGPALAAVAIWESD